MRWVPVLVLLSACASGPRSAPRCQLLGATITWIEGSLAAWDDVRERALHLPVAPPPPLVLYDRYCTYTLASGGTGPIAVRAGRDTLRGEGRPHGGRIALPNGLAFGVHAEAFASLLPGDTAAFLVMALEDVWRADPQQAGDNENWPAYLRRSFVHEMTHTRQLVALTPALRLAGGRVGLVDLDDDVVQQRFDSVQGFRQSVLDETALLYRAAAEASVPERRRLARQALRMLFDRRIAAYGSADAPWARVEQLLLDMEGAGQWAALAHVRQTSRLGPISQRDLVRGSRQYWSQEQGLALYLALDAIVPAWPAAVFSDDPPTSVELLGRALRVSP